MSEEQTYNPYDSFRRLSEMWEKGLNDILLTSIDNKELIRMTSLGVGMHSRYVQRLKRNQELMATMMNIPTKHDVANVAKLTVQAEEKVDTLQQQIWALQDSFALANTEQQQFIKEIMNFNQKLNKEWEKLSIDITETKKLSGELKKLKQELEASQEIKATLEEVKNELVHLRETKAEVEQLKELLKREEKEEAALTTAGLAK
ncbi:polyhydroxyalkanoate biosynthesis repressor PhaR [Mesobacillus maritimus]|uniref:polyhydroxyalkanoate biosynthesis repressor PhaR n=1 Tax=Mesobacillus maritimus TaxID=1643336 RepID=UPI0038508098